VILSNELIEALLAHDGTRSQSYLEALRAEAPAIATLPAFDQLVQRLTHGNIEVEPTSVAIAAAADDLTLRIAPAARTVMGASTHAFVAPWFRELAKLAMPLPYDRYFSQAHAASLLLEAGDDAASEAAIATIPGHHERPTALRWLSIARYRQRGLEAARPSLFALALRNPAEVKNIIDLLADPVLQADWTAFLRASVWESVSDADLPRWFPAWFVNEHNAGELVAKISLTGEPPGRALAALRSLLTLERSGVSAVLVKERETLRRQNEDLYQLYLAQR
jgi:hypothetical protein